MQTANKISRKPKAAKDRKTYTHAEVLAASTNYFKGDDLAASVWLNKYALKDTHGNLYELTPDDMHRRIASEIARAEAAHPDPYSEKEIFAVLKDFKYIVPVGAIVNKAMFLLPYFTISSYKAGSAFLIRCIIGFCISLLAS